MSHQLSQSQQSALRYITDYARTLKDEAERTTSHILRMTDINDRTFEDAISKLKTHARIALHFHPDRPDLSKKSVAEALLEQGIYKSQFETLLSNGGVSAYPGGERDDWEEKLFGGAYQIDGVTNRERPKYGALHVMLHPDGPAPRFGSCYFLLSPKVSDRSTFTYMDSHQNPKEKGTYQEFDTVAAALLEDAFVNERAIGERDITVPRLIEHLLVNLDKPFSNPVFKTPSRNLNHYIEAQVHGDISLHDDVEILVADPSFKDTDVGRTLERLCKEYSITLYWHSGFTLPVAKVPTDFRGNRMPSLALRIAKSSYIDARTIGEAVMDLAQHPSSWSDRGSFAEVLQELKLLWHVLVRYGHPLDLPM